MRGDNSPFEKLVQIFLALGGIDQARQPIKLSLLHEVSNFYLNESEDIPSTVISIKQTLGAIDRAEFVDKSFRSFSNKILYLLSFVDRD